MKDKGITRDIGSRNKRTTGEAPSLGQIPRMPRRDDPSLGGTRRRRRVMDADRVELHKKREQRSRSVTLVWSFTLGAVGVMIVGVALVFWLKPMLERRAEMARQVRESEKILASRKEAEPVTLGETGALDLTKRALKTRDKEEILSLIQCGPKSASEVISFLDHCIEEDGQITGYEWLNALDTTREDLLGVVVNFEKDGKTRNRLALLTPDAEGVWKMDFPAFARLAVPEWSDLMDKRADSAVVRVYVAGDQYYNGPFREDEGWRCFGLASPDLPDLLFGYCQKNTPQAEILSQIFIGGKSMARMTLEIERVEGADVRQFKIKRVLAEDWAMGAKAADEP